VLIGALRRPRGLLLGKIVGVVAVLALAILAAARPAAAEWATVTVPPSGSTVGIPGPFGPMGEFDGPYFPMSWSCSGTFWHLYFDSNTNPVGWPWGATSSVRQEWDPTWRAPLLIHGLRETLPATGTITGRFECQKSDAPFGVLSLPFSTTVTYDVAPTTGVIPPGAPPGTEPTPPPFLAVNAARVAAFKQAKQILERDRRKMLDAIEELKEQNEVFCSVAGSLSTLSALHAFQWNGIRVVKHKVIEELASHSVCGVIPDVVKVIADADRKLDYNRKLIQQLDNQIRTLEQSSGLASNGQAAALASTAMRARATRLRPRDPLAVLETQRNQVFAALGAVATAIGKGTLDDVKPLAQSAASRLSALPASCNAARRYLRKAGLGNRFSRARILRALRRLSASSLPRTVAAFAKALHIGRAQMKRLIRRAKSVPTAHVKATAASDLFCSPKLDAIEKSLTSTLGTLATAL
jgi:hypothetical protein